MAGRRLEGGARIRRAVRDDLPALHALMAARMERSERFDRRTLRSLGGVVSVVEDAAGTVRAAMSLAFVRSFARGHWEAHLDGLWVAPGGESLMDELIAAAERAAARRHCHALCVRGPLAARVQAAVERRGAVEGAVWRLEVAPLADAPARRGRRRPA